MPLAYLLTWTTYGTWLHGDARGSVDNVHDAFGKPMVPADQNRQAAREAQLGAGPVALGAAERGVVTETIRRHCGVRKWKLLEMNVRTNHVHVVVAAAADPDAVMSQFKAWCTRRLREGGPVGGDQPVWTEGGSTRYLWDEESVARARHYVRNEQGPEL